MNIIMTDKIQQLLAQVDETKYDRILFQATCACCAKEYLKKYFDTEVRTLSIEYAVVKRYVDEELKQEQVKRR